jgi:hypothetical protein
VFGSASHSGFGKEPAIVVGNSIGASRSVLIERLCAMFAMRPTRPQADWNRVTPRARISDACLRMIP